MRKAHTFLVTATVLAGGAIGLLAGCTTTHAQGFGDEDVSTTHRLSRAHALPMHKPGMPTKQQNPIVAAAEHKQAAAAGAQLTYQGGPLIQSVKVYVVFWGTGQDSTVTSGIGQYFSTITNSPYFDWLSEYDANGMSIGRGSYAGSYNITPSVTGSTIDDSQIQSELSAQISAGHLPQPDANTLYMTYFPPGVTITMGGSSSCQAFCAYHGTVSSSGGNIYYGVMPDLGGACAGGCYGSDIFTSNTVVSSHEMIEAVTDPGVGIGSIGWYDNTNGEIGDICVGQGGTIDNYSVQLEWSNANNACIDQAPGGGSSSGGSSSGSSSGGSSSSSSSGSSSGSSSSSGSGSSGGSSSSSGSGSSGGSSSSSGSGSSGGSSSGSGSSGGSTSSSGGGSSGGGACMPEQEPNDTPDQADDLSGGCVSGNVDPASDVDFAAFQLSDGQTYDVQLAPSGDANVVLYKWVGYWGQVASTSSTEITHTSQGGGYYLTEVWSPGQQTQSYQLTLTVQ